MATFNLDVVKHLEHKVGTTSELELDRMSVKLMLVLADLLEMFVAGELVPITETSRVQMLRISTFLSVNDLVVGPDGIVRPRVKRQP